MAEQRRQQQPVAWPLVQIHVTHRRHCHRWAAMAEALRRRSSRRRLRRVRELTALALLLLVLAAVVVEVQHL